MQLEREPPVLVPDEQIVKYIAGPYIEGSIPDEVNF
jgi:hypothetical protein